MRDPQLAWAAPWAWLFLLLQYLLSIGYCWIGYRMTRRGSLLFGEVRGSTMLFTILGLHQVADAISTLRRLTGEQDQDLSVARLELRSMYFFRFLEMGVESVPQLLLF